MSMTFEEKQSAAVFMGIFSIEAAFLYKLIMGQAETEVIIAICFVGILFLLWYKADSLKGISADKDGIKVELEVRQLQKEVTENKQEIVDLILLSMGKETFDTLKKLARDVGFQGYNKPHYEGLETELYYLRNLGYIKLKEGTASSIFAIPEPGKQLSQYIEVTEAGHKYICLRNKHEPKEQAPTGTAE